MTSKTRNKKASSKLDVESYKKFTELYETERLVIQQIMSLGYKNHKEDAGHNSLLEGEWHGIKWRRFLLLIGDVDQFSLEPSQIKEEEFDEEWCKTLKSLIEKFGLEYPIVTSNDHGSSEEKIQAGHNRLNCWRDIYGNTKPIPRILISEPYYVKGNKLEVLDKVARDYYSQISRIKSNCPPPNNPYKLKDVAVQVKGLFQTDPTLRGANPSGKWFQSSESKVYHNLLDELHPRQFTSKKARTDIFNLMNPAIPNAKKKVVTRATTTYDLINLGWFFDKKAETFMQNFDQKNKAYIAVVQDVIPNFRSTVYVNMLRHGGAKKAFDGDNIFVHCTLNKLQDLDKERKEFLTHALEWNTIAQTFSFPKIKKVFFPQQLLGNLDKNCLFELQKDGTFKQVQ